MSAFGSITALAAGTATLARTTGQQHFWIGNADTSPLTLTFKDGSGNTLGQYILESAAATGHRGDVLDSVSFPIFLEAVSVVLTSTIATAQFFSGASLLTPTHMFIDTKPTHQ